MNEDQQSRKQRQSIKQRIAHHKRASTVVIFIVLFAIAVILIAITLIPKPIPVEKPALKIGQTSLSKTSYDKLVSQGTAAKEADPQVKATISDYVRYQEIARELKLSVPDYFVAAQQDNSVFIPYDKLSEYQRAYLYPQAVKVLVALSARGGSLITVYHLPYDTGSNGDQNKTYAQLAADNIASKISSASSSSDMLHGAALQSVYGDLVFNYADGVNKSGIYALTVDGKAIRVTNGTDLAALPPDQVQTAPLTIEESFPADIFANTKDIQIGVSSPVEALANPSAFVVIHKDADYAQQTNIQSQYNDAVARLGGGQL